VPSSATSARERNAVLVVRELSCSPSEGPPQGLEHTEPVLFRVAALYVRPPARSDTLFCHLQRRVTTRHECSCPYEGKHDLAQRALWSKTEKLRWNIGVRRTKSSSLGIVLPDAAFANHSIMKSKCGLFASKVEEEQMPENATPCQKWT
jgi:hypothetical protein